jgi:hypothetical protein
VGEDGNELRKKERRQKKKEEENKKETDPKFHLEDTNGVLRKTSYVSIKTKPMFADMYAAADR